MGDLFDDFMDELRRRQGRSEGPKEPKLVGGNGPDDDPGEPEPLRPRDRRRAGGGGGGGREGGGILSMGGWAIVGGILVVVLLLVLLFGRALVDLWTDALWYQSVGYEPVFWARVTAQVGLFVLGGVLAGAFLFGNLWLAGRLAVPPARGSGGMVQDWLRRLNEAAQAADRGGGGPWTTTMPQGRRPVSEPVEMPDLVPVGRWFLAAFALLIALGVAGGLAGAWETILLWQNRVPFSPTGASVPDPVFNRDIGFFLFELPFLRLVQAVLAGLALTGLLIVGLRYLLSVVGRGLAFNTPVRLHLAVLGALFLVAVAIGHQLDKLELVYSSRGGDWTGVSYTDANAQAFAFDVLTLVSGVAALAVVAVALTRRPLLLAGTVGVWIVASIGLGQLFPEAIQRFVVAPNQFAQEQPYIQNNITMTRLAFGFQEADGSATWESRRYAGNAPLTQEVIDEEEVTFRNARLWDYRPLGDTISQLQVIRRYYSFWDVDTDRYVIDDVQRQVMLSARELDQEGNPQATGFVNRRIIFTHGIGVVKVPVNEVANEGQPRFLIRNLPPVSAPGVQEVTQPRIYFGERPSDYIVTNARQPEFDYPRGEGSGDTDDAGVEYRWTGDTGIPIGSALNRLLFAIRFGDLDLLISDQVLPESQLLFNRSIGARVPAIAPFLRYDKDPYVVIDGNGGLVYLWDAYTVSSRFPHANRFSPADLGRTTGLAGSPFNYIRNSVKVAVNAYDGTTTYYVADPDDPLIRAWQGVFPGLFRPLSEMPEDLQAHLRVPEELFNVQTRMYGRYHVTDPLTFFQSDDLWMVPSGQTTEQTLPSEAYYVVMRMPGEEAPEFLLLQPMVPTARPNMIAWVAARNDRPHYGQVRVYRFPADTTVLGPAQIDARIDQDPLISQQISLWNQSGSRVIRGNMIVVPVAESLLYLQPVYLQSTAASLPEFRRIIVASSSHVVWAPTLGGALRELLTAQGEPPGPGPTPSPGPTPTPGPGTTPGPEPTPSPDPGELPGEVAELIEYANEHFELAQQALREGDFARYGAEMELVEEALARLAELVGAP